MITCQIESVAMCIAEVRRTGLLALHWEHLALNKDHVPLAPQYASYVEDERQGKCQAMVLRADGNIIGYWVHYVAPGKHYETSLTSIMDIFFIHPEWRRGSAILRLMRAVETECRRRGVQRWFATEKIHAPIGKLFKAFGFEHVENVWLKWLGPKSEGD